MLADFLLVPGLSEVGMFTWKSLSLQDNGKGFGFGVLSPVQISVLPLRTV